MDLGPSGFFDQEKVVLASALGILHAKGVDKETLDDLLKKVILHSFFKINALSATQADSPGEGGRNTSDESSGFKFEQKEMNFDELEYQFSGGKNSNVLRKVVRNEIEKQKKQNLKDAQLLRSEQIYYRKFGNPRAFDELRNPLKRLRNQPGPAQLPPELYFDCWSKLHSIYCHYGIENNDENAMVYHVIFDESGSRILSGAGDGLIKIFDRNLNLETTIRGHKKDISILTVADNDRFIISADDTGIVRLWEYPTGKPLAVLTEQLGHDVTTVTFHIETVFDEKVGEEVPWRCFLMTTSGTAGLLVYDERHLSKLSNLIYSQQ